MTCEAFDSWLIIVKTPVFRVCVFSSIDRRTSEKCLSEINWYVYGTFIENTWDSTLNNNNKMSKKKTTNFKRLKVGEEIRAKQIDKTKYKGNGWCDSWLDELVTVQIKIKVKSQRLRASCWRLHDKSWHARTSFLRVMPKTCYLWWQRSRPFEKSPTMRFPQRNCEKQACQRITWIFWFAGES